jgi:hypothetical protein
VAAALFLLGTVFITDEQWLSETALSACLHFSTAILWISIFLLPPMFYFAGTRMLAACITEFDSFVFGLTLWFMGVKLTLAIVGPLMVIFGLLLFGLGCVPFAFFLTWYVGRWVELEILAVLLVLCLLCRTISYLYFMNRMRREQEEAKSERFM